MCHFWSINIGDIQNKVLIWYKILWKCIDIIEIWTIQEQGTKDVMVWSWYQNSSVPKANQARLLNWCRTLHIIIPYLLTTHDGVIQKFTGVEWNLISGAKGIRTIHLPSSESCHRFGFGWHFANVIVFSFILWTCLNSH